MLVHQILRGKEEAAVFTIPPGTSVAEATEELSARRIGAAHRFRRWARCRSASCRNATSCANSAGAARRSCPTRSADVMTKDLVICVAPGTGRRGDAENDSRSLSPPAGDGGRADDRADLDRRCRQGTAFPNWQWKKMPWKG